MRYTLIDSPLGELLVVAADSSDSLRGLYLPTGKNPVTPTPSWQRDDSGFEAVRTQLREYFAGGRQHFELPLDPVGTAFQLRVWQQLRTIGYGQTESYATTAAAIGAPRAARAVGLANGRNPISIVVPCHRVIGANGSLTGYGGGLDAKRWLLAHEAKHADDSAAVPRALHEVTTDPALFDLAPAADPARVDFAPELWPESAS